MCRIVQKPLVAEILIKNNKKDKKILHGNDSISMLNMACVSVFIQCECKIVAKLRAFASYIPLPLMNDGPRVLNS